MVSGRRLSEQSVPRDDDAPKRHPTPGGPPRAAPPASASRQGAAPRWPTSPRVRSEESLGAQRSGETGGPPRDSAVISPPPSLPPGTGGGWQALVNDDDSITGACGGLGQTNAEQMPQEEGRPGAPPARAEARDLRGAPGCAVRRQATGGAGGGVPRSAEGELGGRAAIPVERDPERLPGGRGTLGTLEVGGC